MKFPLLTSALLLVTSLVYGMTEQEFMQLYEKPDKDAEDCYRLYEAFSTGDGTNKDNSQARKWILTAHMCGKIETRKEIGNLPWRHKKPFKPAIKVPDVSDDVARDKGQEIVDILLKWHDSSNATIESPKKLPGADLQRVKKLLEEGADPNVTHFDNSTLSYHSAFSLACVRSEFKLAKLLLDYGADPSANGNLALNSVMYSPMMGEEGTNDPQDKLSVKAMTFIIMSGADVNIYTESGLSPVHLATFERAPSAIRLLVKAGADPDKRANPHECVQAAGSPRRVDYRYKACRVIDRVRPIYFAITSMHVPSVRALVKSKIDLSLHIFEGKTALDVAKEQMEEAQTDPDANDEFKTRSREIVSLLRGGSSGSKKGKKKN